MYVNIGAPSNECQPQDRRAKMPGQDPCPLLEKHGGIWRFDENRAAQKQDDGKKYATGCGRWWRSPGTTERSWRR